MSQAITEAMVEAAKKAYHEGWIDRRGEFEDVDEAWSLSETCAALLHPPVQVPVERPSYQQIIDLVQDCGCIALPALSAPVPDFTPSIIENTEAGISELVIKDGPTVTGQEMTVRPLLDMATRKIVGFQWDIPFPASPEQGETDA